jgi:hypothetical protein
LGSVVADRLLQAGVSYWIQGTSLRNSNCTHYMRSSSMCVILGSLDIESECRLANRVPRNVVQRIRDEEWLQSSKRRPSATTSIDGRGLNPPDKHLSPVTAKLTAHVLRPALGSIYGRRSVTTYLCKFENQPSNPYLIGSAGMEGFKFPMLKRGSC